MHSLAQLSVQGSNAGLCDGREPTEQQLQAARERDRQYFNIPYMLRSSERGYARAPCIRKLACSSASIHASLIIVLTLLCMVVMQVHAR